MVFSSMVFVFAFFAINILVHSLCKSMKAKNICLLISSLIFYSWAGLSFVAIMLFDVAVCWFFGVLLELYDGKARRRLLILCLTIVLLVLGVFKYAGFVFENLQHLTGFPKVVPNIVLPLGISFYTFQLISYVVDVYRKKVPAQRSFWMLLLYASLFHQCVAGPIVRYGDVMDELRERHTTPAMISRGVSRFTVGLAKKAILANSCAVVADAFFKTDAAALALQPAAGLWLSGLAYMLQIYLDFSAYSDMALGMGLMCGLHYRENFDYPYTSTSVTEFWRRWHITLSSFFRDYVYIPLGGNRCGTGRQIFNLFVVWSLTGLWHGASWNYVLWGMYFFVFLVVEKFVLGDGLKKIPGVIRYLGVLLIVFFCWVIFRFEDLTALWTVVKGLFGGNGNPMTNAVAAMTFKSNWALLLVSVVACTPVCANLKLWLKDASAKSGAALGLYSVIEIVHPVLLLVLSAVCLTGDVYNPFIYWIF